MYKNIAILGPGAIGSSIGANLTKAEHKVLLIDQWPAHVEAMKVHGLRIIIPGEELYSPIKAAHPYEVFTLQRQFDIVFLIANSYDTCRMVHFIKPYLKEVD